MDQKKSKGIKGNRLFQVTRERIWFILGGVIFFLLLLQIGLKETFFTLKNVKIGYLLMAVGLIIIAQQFIPFIKWVIMCRKTEMGLSLREIFYLSSGIIAGGIVTPGRSGEFVTAFFVRKMKGRVSSMVFLNRVVESSITLLISILIFGVLYRNFLTSKSWILIGTSFGIALFLLYVFAMKKKAGIFMLSKGKRFLMVLKKFKVFQMILNLEDRIIREVEHFYTSFKKLLSWQTIPVLVIFTCLTWALMVVANWSIFRSVGSEVPFTIIMGVMVLSAIGSFVSPTPGGIGLGDIPPVYFLFINKYNENVGAFILIGRVASYGVAFGWYFFAAGVFHKKTLLKKKDLT